jgi:hypothetical protein
VATDEGANKKSNLENVADVAHAVLDCHAVPLRSAAHLHEPHSAEGYVSEEEGKK